MMKEMDEQSLSLHDNNFEYKKLRKKLIDRILELGDVFNMDILTTHQAIKYMEVMLHFINFYQRNNRTQRLPSDPKPVREVVPKTSAFYGKDTSNRVKALTTVKKELLMITWLLVAAKFNERDENLVHIGELQKECKYTFTYKNITSCEAKILQELNWNMMIQTPLHFIKLFYSTGVVFASDNYFDEISKTEINFGHKESDEVLILECLRSVRKYWDYFANLAVHDYFMLKFKERTIALACIISARKVSKVQPEYSEHFFKIYGISNEEVQPAFERIWNFYQECISDMHPKDTTDISPAKFNENRKLLREQNDEYRTPTSDIKKAYLMPKKIKTNKISFSDLETPQERGKDSSLKVKVANVQGFSDLFPIVEETQKDSQAPSQNLDSVDHKTYQNGDTSKMIQDAIKNNRRLGLYKASSTSIDSDSHLSQNMLALNPLSPNEKPHLRQGNCINRLPASHISHPSFGERSEILPNNSEQELLKHSNRVPMNEKQAHQREVHAQNKSNRRNRKERLKSAHSSQRENQTQNESSKPKSFTMKKIISKVVPKIYGTSGEKFQTLSYESGKSKIQNMLEQISSVQVEDLKKESLQGQSKPEGYSLYGPLLKRKPFKGKSSFIDTDKAKLTMNHVYSSNDLKIENLQIETRNWLNTGTGTTSAYFESVFSGKNTTASGENSEQDKIKFRENIDTDAENLKNDLYFKSNKGTDENSSSQNNIKRGKSWDNRRGRKSRNLERRMMQNSSSKLKPQDSNNNIVISDNTNWGSSGSKSPNNDPKWSIENKSSFNTKKTISKRILGEEKANQIYTEKLGKNFKVDSKNQLFGLEGECSRTFIRKSYKVHDISTYSSQQDKFDHDGIPNMNSTKTRAGKGIQNSSFSKKNSVDHATDLQVKERYLERKKQFKKPKISTKSGLTLRKEVSAPNMSLRYKGASIYMKSN
jgi:hypothetical protein